MLGRLDQLKGRVKELEQQLQETSREVRGRGALPGPPRLAAQRIQRGHRPDAAVPVQAEMERALLQGERESEAARLRQEQEAAQQLQEKLSSLDASIRKERDKVSPTVRSVPCPPCAAALLWGHVLPSLGPAEASRSIPSGFAAWGGVCPSAGLGLVPQPCRRRAGLVLGGCFGHRPSCQWGLAGRLCGVGLSQAAAARGGWHRPRGGGLGTPGPCWGAVSCGESPRSAAWWDILMCDGVRHRSVQLAGGGREIAAGVSLSPGAEEGVPAWFRWRRRWCSCRCDLPAMPEGACAAACVARSSQLLVAGRPAALNAARHSPGRAALQQQSRRDLTPCCARLVSPRSLCSVPPAAPCRRGAVPASLGSGWPRGWRCLGCSVVRGLAELPSVAFGVFVLVLAF